MSSSRPRREERESTLAGTERKATPAGRSDQDVRSREGVPAGLDVAVICGVSPAGGGLEAIRRRGERLETGTVRRLEEGKPILGEVVRLQPRADQPFLCDVHVELPTPRREPGTSTSSGPAQVASDRYRKNWDAIYKSAKTYDVSKTPGAEPGRGRKSLLN
jgi:hypothetical protein